MGMLRSMTNQSGTTINGVLLGEPIDPAGSPCPYAWDDERLPSGVLHSDGTITVDTGA